MFTLTSFSIFFFLPHILCLNQQDLHLLKRIEDRLKTLDSLETKIEHLTTKIYEVEIMFEKKLETIGDNVKVKLDFLKDQTIMKNDNYERINHRYNYMDSKIDKSLTKIEFKIDLNTNSINRLENNLSTRHADMETEIIENTQYLDDIKQSINHLDQKLSNSVNSTKCVELTKTTEKIETTIKDSMILTNATRRELQEGLRSFTYQIGRKLINMNQNLSEDHNILSNSLEKVANLFLKQFEYLGRKIDRNDQDMHREHNLFLDSCYRIQLGEPQIEAKLMEVLENLFDSIKNKSSNTYHEIRKLKELLSLHDSNVHKKIGLVRNTMLEMADKSFDYKQEIMESLIDVRANLEHLLNETQGIINNTKDAEKLDTINSIVQDIQENILEIDNKNREELRNEISKFNNELIKSALINFMKENTSHNKTSEETFPMETFIKNIYETLQSIQLKINKIESNELFLHIHSGYLERLWNQAIGNYISKNILSTKNDNLINITANSGETLPELLSNFTGFRRMLGIKITQVNNANNSNETIILDEIPANTSTRSPIEINFPSDESTIKTLTNVHDRSIEATDKSITKKSIINPTILAGNNGTEASDDEDGELQMDDEYE